MSHASPVQPPAQLHVAPKQIPWPLQSSIHCPGATVGTAATIAGGLGVADFDGGGAAKTSGLSFGAPRASILAALALAVLARSKAPAAAIAREAALRAD